MTEIKSGRREFGDLTAVSHRKCNVEDLRAEQAARCLLVHGEEAPAQPVPPFVIVVVVDADFDLNLRLSPPAGSIWRRQSESGIKVSELELAVITNQVDTGFVFVIFAEIIVRLKFKSDLFVAGHLVGGAEFKPISTGIDAVRFVLIRRHCSVLSAGQRCPCKEQQKESSNFSGQAGVP